MAAKEVTLTSWCDKLASVPTVGIQFPSRYVSSATVLDRLAPVLAQMTEPTVSKQEALTLIVDDEAGYQIAVGPKQLSVAFQHRLRVRSSSGDANPTIQMLSKPRPFTELLQEVSRLLMHASHALDAKSEGVIDRVGVVTATNVSEDDAPPGIRKLLKHFAKPWDGELDGGYSFVLTNPISKTEKHSDRCIHQIQKSDEEGAVMVAKFDWQREFFEPRSTRGLEDVLTSARTGALAYFEEIAEGKRF